MSKVTIFQFTIYDVRSDEKQKSRRWGTLEGIKGVGGQALEDTGTEVDASEVGSEVPGLTVRNFRLYSPEGFQNSMQ